MRIIILSIVCVLLVLGASLVSAQNYEEKESLIIFQSVDNTIEIIPTGNSFDISSVEAILKARPLETYRQEIVFIETDPKADVDDEKILFKWNTPSSQKLYSQIQSQVKTLGLVVPVRTKINFPLQNIPVDIQEYLLTTESIDYNEEISQLASALAGDEDDLFLIEFKLADWVNKHISYNLSTLTSDVNQPASWVLEHKYGVCDEITNVFIALNRALGIPARFVSGIAYTESDLFDENWGNHGWAEVYFPGVGWVPFDVTYKQYGFVDASHISLEKGIDGTSSSAEYNAQGRDFSLQTSALDFQTSIVSEGKNIFEKTSISPSPIKSEVGFGSYNVISISVNNLRDHYVVERLSISQTDNLELISPRTQLVALQPREEKKLYWLVRVNEHLDEKYSYTFPIIISRSIGTSKETSFEVNTFADIYDKEYMEQFIKEEYSLNQALPIFCQYKEPIFIDDYVELHCSLNKGESKQVSVCVDNSCQTISSETQSAVFILNTSKIGFQTLQLYNKDKSKTFFVSYKVNDFTKASIGEVNIPERFEFNDIKELSIKLLRESLSSPENITLVLEHDLFVETWSFEDLVSEQEIRISIQGSQLKKGNNSFKIILKYITNQGEEIVKEKNVYSQLINLTTTEKINIFANTINGKFSKFITTKVYDASTQEEKAKVQQHISIATLLIVVLILLGIVMKIRKIFRK